VSGPAPVTALIEGRRPGFELIAVCTLAWALELQMVVRASEWTSLSQGPLLIAVLVIGARHGLLWGSFACALTAILRALELAWLQTTVGGTATPQVSPEVIAASFALVAIAGTIGDTWLARRGTASMYCDDAWTLFDRLSGHFTGLLDQRHLLERQVVDLKESVPALIGLFGELDPSHPDAIPGTLVSIATRLAGSGQAALYAFRRRRQRGELIAGLATAWPPSLDRDDAVVAHAFARGSHVTIVQIQGVTMLAQAAPDAIQVACEVPVEGVPTQLVMVMKGLALVSFAPARLSAFERAMKVGGKALSRAHAFARTRDLNVDDPLTGAVTPAYFEKRLSEHHALARRHGHTFSLVHVALPPPSGGARSARRRVALKLARAIKRTLRDGDLLTGALRREAFWILCPFTPKAGAEVVARRIETLATRHDGASIVWQVDEVDATKTTLESLTATVSGH
jgi:GGDEF domain-containing protein